jgi:hypothetical protein
MIDTLALKYDALEIWQVGKGVGRRCPDKGKVAHAAAVGEQINDLAIRHQFSQ